MRNDYLLILFLVLCISCTDDDEIPSVTKSNVTFKVQATNNFFDKYQDTLIQVNEDIKFNFWEANGMTRSEDSLIIFRRAYFNLYDETGTYNCCDQFVIKLEKKETKENLIYDSYYSRWKYKSKSDELRLFYQNYDSAYIEFNQSYLRTWYSSGRASSGFKIHEITKVLVKGEEDWFISATFEGRTANRHWIEEEKTFFDLQGEFAGVLK